MASTLAAKVINVPFLFQTNIPKPGDNNAQAFVPTKIGFIQATVSAPGFWELRILVDGTPVASSPNGYGWNAQTVTLDIPLVSYGDRFVMAFNVPAKLDVNGNATSYKPVTVRATFYDVVGGAVLSTVDAAVN